MLRGKTSEGQGRKSEEERIRMLGDTECDTELCLSPGGCLYCPPSHSNSAGSSRMEEREEGRTSHQQQQITIFYGGRVCVCDATELQARAIICMAKRKMEEMAAKKENHQGTESYHPSPTSLTPLTPPALPPLLSPGLSMKRSLQRFLQKRKTRTRESSSPYNNAHHHFPPP